MRVAPSLPDSLNPLRMLADLSPREAELSKKLIFTNATLIITPPNLFGQWREDLKPPNGNKS